MSHLYRKIEAIIDAVGVIFPRRVTCVLFSPGTNGEIRVVNQEVSYHAHMSKLV